MTMHHPGLAEIVRRDPRYAYEAYEFVYEALGYAEQRLGRGVATGEGEEEDKSRHITGRELLQGIRDLALREFGLMARTVFHLWGIDRTDDFGEIVFNLVESNLMSKTEEDCRTDFHDVYDLDEELVKNFRLEPEKSE
jgi:uncharacterized repeat protein (TIGR04138 family)